MRQHIIIAIVFSIGIAFISASCGNKKVERPTPVLTPEQAARASQMQSAPAIPSGGAVTAGAVQHYICPNNCEGSGAASEGTCPVCGTAYMHNQAFHDQAVTQTTQPVAPTGAPEPPQNAAGVWHYTCANGCEGGAGSAVACAGCGSTLTHNSAYHN